MPLNDTAAVRLEIVAALAGVSPVPWAVEQLSAALVGRGVSVEAEVVDVALVIVVGAEEALEDEAFGIAVVGSRIEVTAGGARGAGYALTELADVVRHTDGARAAVAALAAVSIAPRGPAALVRGVLRTVASDVLDLGWFRDRDFWTGYLDELATDRINRVQLAFGMQYNYSHDPDVKDNYLCFAYPFLVDVPGWERVRVGGLAAGERAANLDALRFASDEAARRGIHFQLGLWNHAAQPELEDSPGLRYPISGLEDDETAAYSAEALRLLIDACPGIAGVTFRVHYEGGVPEASHGAFWRTVMSGLRGAGRPLDVDLHAKGVDAELIGIAEEVGAHAVLSAKYWAEHQGLPYHQASVRPLEKARPARDDALRGVTQNERRFTRYGYGDFLAEERAHDLIFRVWPGSQRFLLWADPELFAGYGRLSTIGGALGAELCEPLVFRGRKDTGRDGAPRDLYVDESLTLGIDDWKKYRHEYRLWGRLLFDPEAPAETWLRALRPAFGEAAEHVASALSFAGKVLPLVTVTQSLSASNNYFWPEVFTDMPIAGHARSPEAYDFDLEDPGTWGSASPFDPQIFETADDYAVALVSGLPSGRITPDEVAARLLELSASTEAALSAARASAPDLEDPEFRRVEIDATIQAQLGRFFAGKILAGVGYSLFSATGDPEQLADGLKGYRAGRAALAAVVELADGVYAPNLAFGDRPSEQGSWRDRLEQVDRDVAALVTELADARNARREVDGSEAASRRKAGSRSGGLEHVPVDGFEHGAPLTITATGEDALDVELHFRHLNQGEDWAVAPMLRVGDRLTAVIDAAYTAAPFHLQYFFVLRSEDGAEAWLSPGLDRSLANQPYYVLPGASAA
ncbi:hypothetical protein [Gryllotalpicola protaetiae]|uniref:hypothetical protein n=1 Tax=Gryllotalpicola protaetiae TaxID=2419771 RepID=UPI0013C48791|nr:hypothetical protein [Gryllotalpicola protaetiae]